MNVCFVLGTAPELIKLYPLLVEASRRKHACPLLSTGQDPATLIQQLTDFNIQPHLVREVLPALPPNPTVWDRCRWFFKGWWISPEKFIPSEIAVVLVQGDSWSALLGARWGRRLGKPVVHVEAGLRSGKLFSPFPQEIFRRLISRMASFHLVPDDLSAENLRSRGLTENVFTSGGNTLADAVQLVHSRGPDEQKPPYVVASLNRVENLEHPLRWPFVLETLAKAAQNRKLYLMLQPALHKRLQNNSVLVEKFKKADVEFIPRLPFQKFIEFVAGADYVITDGGSSQEECHYLGVPCLLLRDTTERIEGLHSNCLLSKFDAEAVEDFIADPSRWRRPPAIPSWSPSALIWDTLEKLPGGPTV